jgi:iron complex outermembrane receptor protein
MRVLLLVAALAVGHLSLATAAPPAAPSLSGRVTDTTGAPLAQVQVTILEANRSTVTDAEGHYALEQLPTGTFSVAFRTIGFRPEVRRVTLASEPVTLDLAMKATVVELTELQVTASPLATSTLESPQPTTVLGGEELSRAQAASLGETLNSVPGVHSLSTGAGIGKPVIRGLTSNRVLVLDDGQRMETQQWGDEHSPNIETANAERVEVIRGPASVLYGSDALGGVINVLQPDLPDAIGRSAIIRGTASAAYSSNNREPDGSVMVEGASNGFAFRAEGSGRSAGDVRTPTYQLWNSGLRQGGGSGTLAYQGAWGTLRGTYSQRNEKLFLTDEDSTATPTQRMVTNRASLDLTLPFHTSRLEAKAGWERSRRQEFEDSITSDVALGLLSKTWTGSVQYHHPDLGKVYGIVGVSGLRTTFDKFGEETLIPNNRVWTSGVYAFEQADIGRWHLSAGARYDYRHLDVDQDDELGVAAQTRTYNSLSGNVGVLYRLTEPVALVLNVGRGFRAPNSFELFANGVHEGTVAFERGDPALRNETSVNTDLALRLEASNITAEIGGFANYIHNFIFSIPTGETDPGSAFEIFDFTQGNARLAGFEGSVQYHPVPYLHLQLGADYTNGQNTSANEPLPTIPPFRATYTVRFEPQGRGMFQSPYLSFGGECNTKQTRLNPAEAEFFAEAFEGTGFQSEGYTLANAGAGFTLNAGANPMRLDFSVHNLFNKSYADFLSRIKTNAPLPGMGRTFIARVTADF